MAIVESDIVYRLSVDTGPGDANAQADPNLSFEDFCSTTVLSLGTPLNNLWDDVTSGEASAGDTEYRNLFVYNNHATDSWDNIVVWLDSEVSGGATIEIGIDTTAASAVTSASAQALTIANESTAPAGVTFSSPVTKGTGLSLGSLAAQQVRAIWIKRLVAVSTAAKSNDGVTLRCEGDTTA